MEEEKKIFTNSSKKACIKKNCQIAKNYYYEWQFGNEIFPISMYLYDGIEYEKSSSASVFDCREHFFSSPLK